MLYLVEKVDTLITGVENCFQSRHIRVHNPMPILNRCVSLGKLLHVCALSVQQIRMSDYFLKHKQVYIKCPLLSENSVGCSYCY